MVAVSGGPHLLPRLRLLRPLLFSLDPETAHGLATACLSRAPGLPGALPALERLFVHRDPALETMVAGDLSYRLIRRQPQDT